MFKMRKLNRKLSSISQKGIKSFLQKTITSNNLTNSKSKNTEKINL